MALKAEHKSRFADWTTSQVLDLAVKILVAPALGALWAAVRHAGDPAFYMAEGVAGCLGVIGFFVGAAYPFQKQRRRAIWSLCIGSILLMATVVVPRFRETREIAPADTQRTVVQEVTPMVRPLSEPEPSQSPPLEKTKPKTKTRVRSVLPAAAPRDEPKPNSSPAPFAAGTITQFSQGPNSPNIVGDNASINYPRPAPRRLSPDQKAELVDLLRPFPPGDVVILRMPAGKELIQFAEDIIDVFKTLGWKLKADETALIPEGWSGIAVLIHSVDLHPKAADVFANTIHKMGFEIAFGVNETIPVDRVFIKMGPQE